METLTAQHRIHGKRDPVEILVEPAETLRLTVPELPVFSVSLKNVDSDGCEVFFQLGGNDRTGRLERWRFEVRDGEGKAVPVIRDIGFGIRGGISTIGSLKRGESWGTQLHMGDYIAGLPPGNYKARILYSDTEEIAGMDNVSGLTLCQSAEFRVEVMRRTIELARDDAEEADRCIEKLSEDETVRFLEGTYGEDSYDFIAPDSPAGKVLLMRWKAVPRLIEALAKDGTSPKRRAWILGLLFSLTGQNDPRGFSRGGIPLGIEPTPAGECEYKVVHWKILTPGESPVGPVGIGIGEMRNKIDPKGQEALVEEWKRWRNNLVVKTE